MSAGFLTAAYAITTLLETGLTISEVMQGVRATGVVPPAEWDKLDAALKDAEEFWK